MSSIIKLSIMLYAIGMDIDRNSDIYPSLGYNLNYAISSQSSF